MKQIYLKIIMLIYLELSADLWASYRRLC